MHAQAVGNRVGVGIEVEKAHVARFDSEPSLSGSLADLLRRHIPVFGACSGDSPPFSAH